MPHKQNQWQETVRYLQSAEKSNSQPKILYVAKLFKNESKIGILGI